MRPAPRPSYVRIVIASIVLGGMVALGVSTPAFAIPSSDTVTIKVVNKAGVVVPTTAVTAIQDVLGVEPSGDVPVQAVAVTGKPGYFTASLQDGATYTLDITPTGALATNGVDEFLGGGQDLADAQTFTPTSSVETITATFAAEGVITGKVTSPTNVPLKSAEAESFVFDGGQWDPISDAITDKNGVYTMSNLQPGSYILKFFSPTDAYPPVYSGNASTLASAVPVSVQPNRPATANAKFSTFSGGLTGHALVNYDGYNFADTGAIATAYPVLTSVDGQAETIDRGHGVSSAAIGSSGAWTINNLAPGNYVVNIDPAYYNETDVWVGGSSVSAPLSGAEIVVVGTNRPNLGITYLSGADYDDPTADGATPSIFVGGQFGGPPIGGAVVTITGDADGYVYATGVSTAYNNAVSMNFTDGSPVYYNLQPGWYTVTVVSPSGQWEPFTQDQYFGFGSTYIYAGLHVLKAAPGFSAQPTIAETATAVGTSYTVTGAAATRSDATLSYQWLRNGHPIYSATGTSYTSTGADLGDQLSVRVTASSFGFDDVYAYASVGGATPTPTTIGDQLTNATEPSISPLNGVYVGTVLQADAGSWDIDGNPATGVSYSYSWSTGATTPTYTVQPSDIGNPISVTITAHKTGYTDSAPTVSAAPVTAIAHPAPIVTKSPTAAKVISHGNATITGTAGTWSVTGLTYSYKWTVGNPDTGLVLSSSSKLVEEGNPTFTDPLEYTVSVSKPGYLPNSKTIIVAKGTAAFTENQAPQVVDSATPVTASDQAVLVGDSLSVAAPANWLVNGSIAPDSYSYQWFRQSPAPGKGAVAIAGATKLSYVVSAADVGQLLSVRETAISSTYTGAATFGVAGFGTASSALGTTPATVAIHGIAAQGQVLSAVVGAWPTTSVTNSYQWLECPDGSACTDSSNPATYLPIAGATKSTLTVLSSYGNIALRVTGSKTGFTPAMAYSAPAATDAASLIVTLANPSIAGLTGGEAHVGVKLTAVLGKYSVSGLTVHYSWVTCLAAMCGMVGLSQQVGTGSTYTPTAADYNGGDEVIELIETVTRTGYSQKSAGGDTTAQFGIGVGTGKIVKAPTVTTTSTTFTVNPGTYTPVGGSSFTEWFVDGQSQNNPSNQSMPQYIRQVGDAGKAIWETTTYSATGYADLTSTVIAQRGGALLSIDPESVTGSAYGDTLGLSTPTLYGDAAGPEFAPITQSYQWYSNGVAIKGATTSTFKPSTAYIGHRIQVKVTGSTPYYTTTSTLTSSAFVLAYGSLGSLTQPTITYAGTLAPGVTMTAVPGTGYSTTGYAITRQWQKSTNGGTTWASISKATGATYTPAATDVNAQFRVLVTSSKTGYTSQSQQSDPVTVQFSPALATIAPPTVTGAGLVGAPLTANVGTWNTPSLTYAYQWYRDDVLIPGATASTFTPDYTDATDTISFTVTASRVGYAPVTETSNDLLIGLGAITDTVAPKITASGGTYVVSTGSWAVDGLSFSYQWQVGGVNATGSGANTDSYTPAQTDSGELTVIVTATRAGYASSNLVISGPTL